MQQNAVSTAEQVADGMGKGPAHGSAAVDVAGPDAEQEASAHDETTTGPQLSVFALETWPQLKACEGSSPAADEHSIERHLSDVTSLSGLIAPADIKQVVSPADQQREPQELSDAEDADVLVQELDTVTPSLSHGPSNAIAGRGPLLSAADTDTQGSGAPSVPVAFSPQHDATVAAEEPATQAAGDATAESKANGLPVSPAASSAMLSGLGSVNSHASLSALSMGADSVAEPSLDQLSLDGLDDAADMADDSLMEGVTDPSAEIPLPVAAEVAPPDGADDLDGGLSEGEIEFDTAGELSIEPSAADAALQLPPAAAALDLGRLVSPAAALPPDPAWSAPELLEQRAPKSGPFSPRPDTDQPDGAGAEPVLPRWQAALAAAEAVEAELLQGAPQDCGLARKLLRSAAYMQPSLLRSYSKGWYTQIN